MGRYEELREQHAWNVPERYNIAQDVCDKHPRDKLAMVWERFDGERRDVSWGELQDLANQAAHVLRDHGVDAVERAAWVRPPTPEPAPILFGAWKLGAIMLSMLVFYGAVGVAHRFNVSRL